MDITQTIERDPQEQAQEEYKKLNWLEKRGLKNLLKKAHRDAERMKLNKDKASKAILEMADIFDITDEKGNNITKADLDMMDIKEVNELMEYLITKLTELTQDHEPK